MDWSIETSNKLNEMAWLALSPDEILGFISLQTANCQFARHNARQQDYWGSFYLRQIKFQVPSSTGCISCTALDYWSILHDEVSHAWTSILLAETNDFFYSFDPFFGLLFLSSTYCISGLGESAFIAFEGRVTRVLPGRVVPSAIAWQVLENTTLDWWLVSRVSEDG